MAIDLITSGLLRVVFEIAGVAPPVILALTAYIGIALMRASLNPPSARTREESIPDRLEPNREKIRWFNRHIEPSWMSKELIESALPYGSDSRGFMSALPIGVG
jgi:hypothetical protein